MKKNASIDSAQAGGIDRSQTNGQNENTYPLIDTVESGTNTSQSASKQIKISHSQPEYKLSDIDLGITTTFDKSGVEGFALREFKLTGKGSQATDEERKKLSKLQKFTGEFQQKTENGEVVTINLENFSLTNFPELYDLNAFKPEYFAENCEIKLDGCTKISEWIKKQSHPQDQNQPQDEDRLISTFFSGLAGKNPKIYIDKTLVQLNDLLQNGTMTTAEGHNNNPGIDGAGMVIQSTTFVQDAIGHPEAAENNENQPKNNQFQVLDNGSENSSRRPSIDSGCISDDGRNPSSGRLSYLSYASDNAQQSDGSEASSSISRSVSSASLDQRGENQNLEIGAGIFPQENPDNQLDFEVTAEIFFDLVNPKLCHPINPADQLGFKVTAQIGFSDPQSSPGDFRDITEQLRLRGVDTTISEGAQRRRATQQPTAETFEDGGSNSEAEKEDSTESTSVEFLTQKFERLGAASRIADGNPGADKGVKTPDSNPKTDRDSATSVQTNKSVRIII